MRENLKKYWQAFLIEAFLFSLTVSLGIIGTIKRKELLKVSSVSVPSISIKSFIVQFSIISFFIFLAVKFLKKKSHKETLFKSLFVFSIFTGGVLMLDVWLSDVFSLFLMAGLMFLLKRKKSVFLHNLCVILGIAGTISIAGLNIAPNTIVVLLVLFSIYDFIAVYKTKHMIMMAKSMIESGAILGLIIPHRFSGLNKKTDNINKDWAFVLGGGDIAFPLLLICSLASYSIFNSIIVSIFSLMGLLFSFLIFLKQKERKAIPALPPIALLSILGYLLIKFF